MHPHYRVVLLSFWTRAMYTYLGIHNTFRIGTFPLNLISYLLLLPLIVAGLYLVHTYHSIHFHAKVLVLVLVHAFRHPAHYCRSHNNMICTVPTWYTTVFIISHTHENNCCIYSVMCTISNTL